MSDILDRCQKACAAARKDYADALQEWQDATWDSYALGLDAREATKRGSQERVEKAYDALQAALDRLCRAHEALEREKCIEACRGVRDAYARQVGADAAQSADVCIGEIALRARAPVREER